MASRPTSVNKLLLCQKDIAGYLESLLLMMIVLVLTFHCFTMMCDNGEMIGLKHSGRMTVKRVCASG